MAILGWMAGKWFDLLQTVSILVGFAVTTHTIRADTRERKIQNLFTATAAHREIWANLYEHPELARILVTEIDLGAHPVTLHEEILVHSLILHLNASFKARKFGMEFNDDHVATDIQEFFARPIPLHVWNKSKEFQSDDFVAFVESHFA